MVSLFLCRLRSGPHVNLVVTEVHPTEGKHGRDAGEGQQTDRVTESVSFWSKDDLELEATEKEQTPEELSTFPFLPKGT